MFLYHAWIIILWIVTNFKFQHFGFFEGKFQHFVVFEGKFQEFVFLVEIVIPIKKNNNVLFQAGNRLQSTTSVF